MVDIAQLKDHIREEARACQQQLADFKHELDMRQERLSALQRQIEAWVDELQIDGVDSRYTDNVHTLEKFDETFEVTLHTLILSFGSCKVHAGPEEQYLNGHRVLLFASSDEDDIKEIVESEGEFRFADLQFGQKRDRSKYDLFDETAFYKLLYSWLRA